MKQLHPLYAVAVSAFLFSNSAAYAQGSADDQAAVWATVEEIWSAEERGDDTWVDTHLSADFVGWPADSPAPRTKGATRMWARFNAEQSKGLLHELYPLSIVVHGDVAVAHYLYSMAAQTKDKKTVMSNGRYTDILVRDGTTWKFISWHGGSDSE
jgi:ketosteroid isomerase-like protein